MYKNNSKKKKENERWMSFSIFFYHPDPILSLFSSRRMANEVNGVMMDIIIDWKRNLHSYNVNHLRMTWWKDHERYGRADDEGRIRLSDSDIEIAYDSSFRSALPEGEGKVSINRHYLSLNGMITTHSLGNATPGLAFPILLQH